MTNMQTIYLALFSRVHVFELILKTECYTSPLSWQIPELKNLFSAAPKEKHLETGMCSCIS